MQDFEKKQFEEWQNSHEFEKIVHYVDLLKEPSYEHLGQKAAALNNLRRYHEAKALLENIYEQGKEDTMWHYRYAYVQMQFERFNEAVSCLKKSVALDETNGSAWYLLSVLYEFYLHEPELAQQAHLKATEHAVVVDYLKDDTYRSQQRFNETYDFRILNVLDEQSKAYPIVEDVLQKLITLFEQHVTNYEQLPDVIQAFVRTIKQTFHQTEESFNEDKRLALEDDVIYILDWFGVAVDWIETLCAMYRFESYQRLSFAIPASRLVTLFKPSELDFPDRVLRMFAQLDTHEKIIDDYLLASEVYLDKDDAISARQLLSVIESDSAEDDMWWQLMAYVHLLEHDYDLAITAFEKSVALNEQNVDAWIGLEQLYLDYLQDIVKANHAREQWENIIGMPSNDE